MMRPDPPGSINEGKALHSRKGAVKFTRKCVSQSSKVVEDRSIGAKMEALLMRA